MKQLQQELAQFILSCGADAIIGSHPHVVQPVKLFYNYDSSDFNLVVYSLGNFVTDQMGLKRYKESVIVHLTLEKGQDGLLIDYELTPVKTYEMGQPCPVSCPGKYACDFVPTLDPTLP